MTLLGPRDRLWPPVLLTLMLGLFWYVSPELDGPEAAADARASGGRAAYDEVFSGGSNGTLSMLPVLRQWRIPDSLGRIRDFLVLDRRLVAVEGSPGNRLFNAEIERSGGITFGEPSERLTLASPSSLHADPSDRRVVWVLDFRTGDFVSFLVQSHREQRRIRLQTALFQPVWVDGRVLTNGMFASDLVRQFSGSGEPQGEWGTSVFPDALPEVAMHLNRSSLAIDPRRHKIVLAFLYVSRLAITDIVRRDVRHISGPIEVRLDYRTVPDPVEGMERFLATGATTYAYVDVAADNEHIYALFSGRSRGEWSEDAILADTLHVFSWSGDLLRQWRLPRPVHAVTLDVTTRKLYAIGPGVETFLLEWHTDAVLASTVR